LKADNDPYNKGTGNKKDREMKEMKDKIANEVDEKVR
jgi:hypothetical protein